MLYVTTRSKSDAYTAALTLHQDRGSDGGLFVPMRLPVFEKDQIIALAERSFGQNVADILNLFFSTKLSGWDVDFAIGRYPVRTEQLPNKIVMAECWHNPDWRCSRLERNLMELLQSQTELPGNWVSVAIRMAVLAGVLGSQNMEGMDIALVSGDFTAAVSAWYLREMGFPIGNIICCCNENNQFWDLICNGQMRTDGCSRSTIVPEADITLPVNLERLISACGGAAETGRYLNCCRTGSQYCVTDGMLRELRKGLYVSVASSDRIKNTIPNVYKTHGYVLSPAASLAYSGLMDYRTKTGMTRAALILCDNSPVCDAAVVADAMEIPVEELKKMI